MKKYSYKDAYNEFINRGYELLSDDDEYINVSSKLRYICPKHKEKGVQLISFGHLKSGKGCYYCGRERTILSKKIKIDREYDIKLSNEKGFQYIDSADEDGIYYIYFICDKHQDKGVQKMRKSNMKRKSCHGCRYCNPVSSGDFKERYSVQRLKILNPNIEILDDYTHSTDKVRCLCKIHNIIHTKTINSIISGNGCLKCGEEKVANSILLTDEEVENRVHVLNNHISLLEYNGYADSNSKWFCNKHGVVFYKTLSTLCNCKSGCDLCYSENIVDRLSINIDDANKIIQEKFPSLLILNDGTYTSFSNYANFYCSEHNYYFRSRPVYVKNRIRCCQKSAITCKAEKMCSFLESLGLVIEREKIFEDCRDVHVLPFDCYIPQYNLIIEYDGEQHYKPVKFDNKESEQESLEKLEYTQRHDRIKNNYCKVNQIDIIRVPYYVNNMELFLLENLKNLGVNV